MEHGSSLFQDAQEFQQFVGAENEVSKGVGYALHLIFPQQVQRRVAKAGEGSAADGMSDAATIFAEGHVSYPVQAFDLPVAAPVSEQGRGIRGLGWKAGDGMDHLDGGLAAPAGGARQLADLGQTRPISMSRQTSAGKELPPHLPPMFFAVCFNLRKMLLSLAFRGGGKSRAGSPPPGLPSGSVDCP